MEKNIGLDVTLFSDFTKLMEERHGKKAVENNLEKIMKLLGEMDRLYAGLPDIKVDEPKIINIDKKACIDCGKKLGSMKFHAESGGYRCYSCYDNKD